MLELDSGSISVDGINISAIPRQEVRSRLNTIPQEPFFLHGSVRENLDPLGDATDERLAEVLRTVQLWEFFEARGVLDKDVNDETMSHGQRQLFCLARAVIKRSSILVMDEAGSSVDADTDELMQGVLQEAFKTCTTIAIVHKLHTVLDFDRVVVLEKGRVSESGRPRELLERQGSSFKALYESMNSDGE